MKPTTIQEFRRRYPIRPNDDAFILGSGSYGKVVKVEDQVETEWVAVKISEFKGDDGKSLRAEVELARKIPRHPNIARYDESYRFETDTNVCDFAIMRYYPDGNLAMLMRQVDLTPAQKDDIVRGVLLGLQHLHRQRIVHRDFKPANILISRDNQGRFVPKIADFGLSKLVHEDEIESSDFDLSDGRGTPSYKAPEQIVGGKVSFNLDLWAFGVILFELFTGEKPFAASQKSGSEHVLKREIEKKIVNVVLPESVRQIPEPYQTLVRRCLVKDVRKRARKEDELLDLLDGISALLNEARQAVEEGNFAEAIARYETVLGRRENHPKATEGLKTAHELAQKQSGDIEKAERQHRLDAKLAEADDHFARRDYARAKPAYEAVLALDDRHAAAKNRLSRIDTLERQRRRDERLALGWKFFAENQYAQAKLEFEKVLKEDPDNPPARQGIADCATALAPPAPPVNPTAGFAPEEHTDLFVPEPVRPAEPKKPKRQPPAAAAGRVQSKNEVAAPVAERPVPAPTRPRFAVRPVYGWVVGVALAVSVGWYFWASKSTPTSAAGKDDTLRKKAEGKGNGPNPTTNTSNGGLETKAVSVSEGSLGRAKQYTWFVEQAKKAMDRDEFAKAKNYLAQAQTTNPSGREWRQVAKALQQREKSVEAKSNQQVANPIEKPELSNQPSNPAPSEPVSEPTKIKVDNTTAESVEASQTQYNELLEKGANAINSGNRKALAIEFFNQAQQLAHKHKVSTANAAKFYASYVGRGDLLFQNEDPDGAKAWYLVAQAVQNTEEITRKIRACAIKQ